MWEDRLVQMRYRRWRAPREVTRVVARLGVVLKAGRWYLVARCGEQLRTYRVGAELRERLTATAHALARLYPAAPDTAVGTPVADVPAESAAAR